MSTAQQTTGRTEGKQSDTAIYVYGIVPADVEVEEDAAGIGDPPGAVDIVREGDIAALVSPIPTDRPLGKPADLRAHAQLLDGTAAVAPVVPLRFGAVMTDTDAVASELLREHYDEFTQALNVLEGYAEYIVKGRYDEQAFLAKLLAENEEAQALREDIRDKPEDASRNSRMALGELIAHALELQRQADNEVVVNALDGVAKEVSVREPTHEWDAANVALLAEVDRQADVEAVLERLREKCGDSVDLRLLGPLAAYDFVATPTPGG